MYASPRFTEASLLAIYENQAFTDLTEFEGWSYEKWRAGGGRSYHVAVEQVALLRQYLPEGSRVLDVGCGTGSFVREARAEGFLAEGVEPSRMLADIAARVVGVPVAQCQIEQFRSPYPFDAIVIWDVLEHLYEPVRVVGRAAEMLKPGGVFIAQVPHHRGLGNRIKSGLTRLGLRSGDFKHFGFPWHVYAFDRRSLTTLLAQADLRPFRFESWPHQMKDGRQGLVAAGIIRAARRWCLSDYITCVARKAAGVSPRLNQGGAGGL